jgi:hypothetical protein
MGRLLAARGTRLDTIVVGPALRALTTARLIAAELGYGDQAIEVEARSAPCHRAHRCSTYPGEFHELCPAGAPRVHVRPAVLTQAMTAFARSPMLTTADR